MQHKELAEFLGMDSNNIFVNSTGDVLELDKNSCKRAGTVPSGRVLIDGYGVGDVGNIVLRDRRHLAQDGLIVAGTPAFASELENYFSKIEDYIAETGNHVTYRVDPLYEPEAKLCNGVFLKARSMEDDMLSFDVFVYNEQPEFVIDRKTSDIRDLKKKRKKKAARGRGA